jgi:uncharacterized Fe-S center protein
MSATVHFASVAYDRPEADATLPARFMRVLARYPLAKIVKGKRVALKMHLGGELGYSTIPPLFVRLLVQALTKAGGQVFVTDNHSALGEAVARGYTPEVLGAPIIPATGLADRYFYPVPVEYKTLREIQVAGEIHDADVLVDFSHVKGHGACGYGGACKNLAMGCVTGETRSNIHALQGGLIWDGDLCSHCETCIESCRYGANRFTEEDVYEIDYETCHYCQHCANACPQGAIALDAAAFADFQEGMALSTQAVLASFAPERVLFINLLLHMTYLCDCWGFTTPPLHPDVGLVASQDIVAVEQASLDLIHYEELMPLGLPKGRAIGDHGHLFERIHGKDPFVQVRALERRGLGTREYELVEVR